MMTRHSVEGVAITVSTAEAILRAPGLHQHGAPAAEQRHRVRFFDEPCRIAGELIAFDARQREWIVGIVDRRAHQRVDALAHQTGVGTEYQHDRLRRIGFGDKTVDVGGFDGGHERRGGNRHVPATKYDASRERIFSAITLAARFSASRRPRSPAKRCC